MNPGQGTPIGAIADGVVSSVTAHDDGGLGVHVMIDHVVAGENVTSTYGHMLAGSAAVSVGQTVSAGQLIGKVGSTGQSTGPHLHLELHLNGVTAIDPYGWLTEHAGPM
jgi:murein DD-endopeptidase MepM/ murein hydrolase activator NlpD